MKSVWCTKRPAGRKRDPVHALLPLFMLACGLLTARYVESAERPDKLVANFEGGTYGEWKAEGDAFGTGPARGTLPGQMQVTGFRGGGLVNSYHNLDRGTGTLTSPPFIIERSYISFLIGGGGYAGKTCMNLWVDDKVVRTAAGSNTEPGGSEALELAVWNVSEFAGREAVLQIVDQRTGGWGHINVDHIVQTDTKPKVIHTGMKEKAFTVSERYLIIPIKNQPKDKEGGRLALYIDGVKVRHYGLHLAPSAEQTDWYAFFTIAAYKGREARVVASDAAEEGFALIKQSGTVPGEEGFYKEPHRPQFHFTQKVGWINDPNGMVYHKGTWHFFFQHNPVSTEWGNMTWGHATSKDLLHWEQHPNKLFPKTMAVKDCFSGGATVDKQNTAGWGKDALVAFFTDTGCGEAVAYSSDGGDTFTYYEGNPVVKHRGRDPKVIWYAYDEKETPLNEEAGNLGGHWVMVVYDEQEGRSKNAAFYTSTNLKEWTAQSHLPGYFECTELFELPVNGDLENTRWVVFAADAKYAIGRFDGKTFTPEHEGKHQVHWGPYYASQTFDNPPDGRRIQVGWIRGAVKTKTSYQQHFSFPHQLTLRETEEGIRMFAEPIKEIENLRAKSHRAQAQDLVAGQAVAVPVGSDLLDIRLTVALGDASSLRLKLPGRIVTYDAVTRKLNEAALHPVDGTVSIQVLADRSLTEIVGNEGRVYISAVALPKLDATEVSVEARGGNAKLLELEVHEMQSIWHK